MFLVQIGVKNYSLGNQVLVLFIMRLPSNFFLRHFVVGSFSEESDKIGRGFIKILETWQFGLSFNIIRHVFFCFGPKNFFCRFYEFLKSFGLAQKKIVKSRYWL
jgi:hypothetical protein